MTTHEPNGPRYMDASRINAPINHSSLGTINGAKANEPMQT